MVSDDVPPNDMPTHRTQAKEVRPRSAQPTWWKVPAAASLLGSPFLVLEYRWFRSEDGLGSFGGMFYWSLGLLALSWALPHRPALRVPRALAAGAGLGCVFLPMLFALALGAALSGS